MRSIVVAASLILGIAATARAEAVAGPAQNCIAVGTGTSRIAATVANPADCCTGRMQCAQFLSTTTVVRPAHDQRT